VRTLLGSIMFLDAALFLFCAVQHAGVAVGPYREPRTKVDENGSHDSGRVVGKQEVMTPPMLGSVLPVVLNCRGERCRVHSAVDGGPGVV
jgi:hypothetical protein